MHNSVLSKTSANQQHEQKSLQASLPATLTSLTPSGQLPKNLSACDAKAWIDLVPKLDLSGVTKTLCTHCTVEKRTANELWLVLDQAYDTLYNEKNHHRMVLALKKYFTGNPVLHIRFGKVEQETPALYDERKKQEGLNIAYRSIYNDIHVQKMILVLDASIDDTSIVIKTKL